MKKVWSLIIALCMTISLFSIPVFADTCCDIGIENFVQDSEKVTVYWTAKASVERFANVGIYRAYDTSGTKITGKDYTISNTEYADFVTEFDISTFLKGETYEIHISLFDWCENCYGNSCYQSIQFTVENGCPVYELGNTYSGDFSVSADNIAFKVTAPTSGIYQLYVDSDESFYLDMDIIGGKRLGSGGSLYSGLVYLDAGETAFYTVKIKDWAQEHIQTVQAKFKFDIAQYEIETVLTSTPGDGDTVFSIENPTGLTLLNIPKAGIYDISTVCSHNGKTTLYTIGGDEVVYTMFNESGSVYLEKAQYYYVPESWQTPADDYTTTFKYSLPDEYEFGTVINVSNGKNKYLSFKLDRAAFLRKENESGYVKITVSSGEETYSLDSRDVLLPAGEYLMECTYSGSVQVVKNDVPVTVIGNEINAYTDMYGNKHTVFEAPESGEYEFYLSSGQFFGEDEEWVNAGYEYVVMEKGEQFYVSFYDPITVSKYTPVYTAVPFDQPYSFDIEKRKKTGLLFTAPDDDTYIFTFGEFGSSYFGKIKIYTDSEVIYEATDVYAEKQEISLKKGNKVYIDISKSEGTDYALKITAKERPLQISGNTVIDTSNPLGSMVEREIVYTPAEAGYYNFVVNKTSGDNYAYIVISLNGEELGYISNPDNGRHEAFIYASPAEPLNILITKGTYQTSELELTFDKISGKKINDITNFEVTDNSYYSFILPETGVYKISGSAFYNATSWRDEGVYPYFFSPIIKDSENTSFSYDSSTGEVPVYFCGNKGDEVMFKEEVTNSYYYPFEYPISASISAVETEAAQTDTLVSSSDKIKIYSINIPANGVYKFEDFSDDLSEITPDSYTHYGHGFTMFCVDSEWQEANYDASGNPTDGRLFNLKAGTYYIAAGTYDNIPDDDVTVCARFKITTISSEETPDDEKLKISGTKTANGVAYTISKNISQNFVLYAALYNGTQLKEIKVVKNPAYEGSITFDNAVTAYDCKLFLWDSNFAPLCESTVCK